MTTWQFRHDAQRAFERIVKSAAPALEDIGLVKAYLDAQSYDRDDVVKLRRFRDDCYKYDPSIGGVRRDWLRNLSDRIESSLPPQENNHGTQERHEIEADT